MDAKLQKVIALSKLLQEAVNDCDAVLSVDIKPDNMPGHGVHVYRPNELGLGELTTYYIDESGYHWKRCKVDGVTICGRTNEREA